MDLLERSMNLKEGCPKSHSLHCKLLFAFMTSGLDQTDIACHSAAIKSAWSPFKCILCTLYVLYIYILAGKLLERLWYLRSFTIKTFFYLPATVNLKISSSSWIKASTWNKQTTVLYLILDSAQAPKPWELKKSFSPTWISLREIFPRKNVWIYEVSNGKINMFRKRFAEFPGKRAICQWRSSTN